MGPLVTQTSRGCFLRMKSRSLILHGFPSAFLALKGWNPGSWGYAVAYSRRS
jgi:hypothetical protein